MKTVSTEPSIKEMNRVIQKFMELPTERSVPKFSGGGNRIEETIHHYHTDYNSLHSAWVKFRDLNFDNPEATDIHFNITTALSAQITYEEHSIAHKALYDAIVWYNSINTKP